MLLVGDPEIMRHIYVKDFDHFMDRRTFNMPSKKDRVMANMLSMKTGEEWKKLRAIMSPTFTSGKIKGMFPLVCKKADQLVSFCLKEARTKPFVDMKYNFGRFTLDTIASCAFVARETMRARQSGNKRGDFLDLLLEAEVSTGDAEGISAVQDDNKSSTSKQTLNELTIISQSVMFLLAGYDTTASTLAFVSILLAKHPEIQQRLRQEMSEMVEEHGDITYQGIMEAKYLDACIMETLRLYPPGLFLERKCVKEYNLSQPTPRSPLARVRRPRRRIERRVEDGLSYKLTDESVFICRECAEVVLNLRTQRQINSENRIPGTDVTIEPGMVVTCPLFQIHRDPKYWPEPEVFRPERFLPENKANITHLTHIPFGIGPRNCLAMRFALMEAKVALAKMLLASDIRVAPGHEEIKTDFGMGLLRPKDGVNLLLTPLKEE
ncbi:Cytochrome P450 9e2 [Penaeus vannamei]|uniref:Cytochrome P450 9e2 n=1 Tax=Penaeus vannamei TaxID=6689 RepID=A0A3R7QV69_PENVA|nr:Cytochrome P450 9e2 [Penaeus vannamei]